MLSERSNAEGIECSKAEVGGFISLTYRTVLSGPEALCAHFTHTDTSTQQRTFTSRHLEACLLKNHILGVSGEDYSHILT